jgi:hypothetical protein
MKTNKFIFISFFVQEIDSDELNLMLVANSKLTTNEE